MCGVLLCCSAHQVHGGPPHTHPHPPAGVLLCRLVRQALKGAPWVGSYSVVQCVRLLMGQSLLQLPILACGEREAMVVASPPMHDSAVSLCFYDWQTFLYRYFPPQSPPSHPTDLSLLSQQRPSPWDCSIIPKLQLPAAAPSSGPVSLSGVCMAVARTV